MNILFVASVAAVAVDPPESRKLYLGALNLPLEPAQEGSEYYSSEKVGGCKHFGVWPLSEAAQACFGADEWPADRTIPQASIEFEVEDAEAVEAGAGELVEQGFELLHPTKTEPWGQTIARVLSAEGLIVGVSFAPWLHD